MKKEIFTYRQERMLLLSRKKKTSKSKTSPLLADATMFRSSKVAKPEKEETRKFPNERLLLESSRPPSRLSDSPKAVFADSNVFHRPHSAGNIPSTTTYERVGW
jgi:hypothetical protein